MFSFLVNYYKILNKAILLIGLSFFLFSCTNSGDLVGASKYDSSSLAKDWRSNVKEKSLNRGYVPPYMYPNDNDSEYVYPVRKYSPPKPTSPNIETESYPQDNDGENINYPSYDSDADNSGYYYMNKDKRLPKADKQPNSSDYNYPIYFD